MDEQSVDYGNWVPKKMLIALLLLTSLFGAATLTRPHNRSGSSRHPRSSNALASPLHVLLGTV